MTHLFTLRVNMFPSISSGVKGQLQGLSKQLIWFDCFFKAGSNRRVTSNTIILLVIKKNQ